MAADRRLALLAVVALACLCFDTRTPTTAAAEPRHADVGSDFNGDGYSDLAVCVTDSGNFVANVAILHGSPTGLRRTGSRFAGTKTGPATLVTGDFDGDHYADLAIGDSDADPGGISGAGMVRVIYGSAAGLDPRRTTVWHQGRPGVPGRVERDDAFGATLAVGAFGRGGADDLAISSPGESGHRSGAGSVTVLYGSRRGLTAAGSRAWTSSTRGVPGIGNHYEGFGTALAAGRFSASGYDDLAIGVPDQTQAESLAEPSWCFAGVPTGSRPETVNAGRRTVRASWAGRKSRTSSGSAWRSAASVEAARRTWPSAYRSRTSTGWRTPARSTSCTALLAA